ncbi:MAG: carbon-nitrogen hydrolase family protein [Rhodobacterales bacterium]|nr:carbon-nitrogen hydrolase family protein [Rhodobacterales bacterium]
MFLAAVVQLNCTSNSEKNWSSAEALIRRAAQSGATLVATPENSNFLGPHHDKVRLAEPITGPTVQRFADLARELDITLVVGSVNERSDDPNRCYNTTIVLTPQGEIAGSYRKVHLFDVDLSDEVRFLETNTTVAGDAPVVAQTPAGMLGLSICYDLRFPEHYRQLLNFGAQLLMVPSAFTSTTGQAHWEPLLRARAIENQCYVLAPGQVGHHDDNGLRHSHGNSMIIDPWGLVIARCSDGPGLALAEIDLERLRAIRRGMPCASHRRLGLTLPRSKS